MLEATTTATRNRNKNKFQVLAEIGQVATEAAKCRNPISRKESLEKPDENLILFPEVLRRSSESRDVPVKTKKSDGGGDGPLRKVPRRQDETSKVQEARIADPWVNDEEQGERPGRIVW